MDTVVDPTVNTLESDVRGPAEKETDVSVDGEMVRDVVNAVSDDSAGCESEVSVICVRLF